MDQELERIEVFTQIIKDLSTGRAYRALVTKEGYLIGRQRSLVDLPSTAIPVVGVDIYLDGHKDEVRSIGTPPPGGQLLDAAQIFKSGEKK